MSSPVAVERSTRAVPTDIFLRSILISLVLIHHITELNFAGAAHALLAIAGYNFSRFQLPQLIAGQGSRVIRTLTINVIIPYFIVLIPIFAFIGVVFWPNYFLVSNFVVGDYGINRPTIYWYIESYIFIIGVLCLVISYRPVRNIFESQKGMILAGFFIASIAIRLLSEINGDFGNFSELGVDLFAHNTPLMLATVFMAGWLIHEFEGRGKQYWALSIIPLFFILPPSDIYLTLWIFVPSIIVLTLVRAVSIPKQIAGVVHVVAACSLYIYMGQSFVLAALRMIFGQSPHFSFYPISFAACIIFGITVKLFIDAAIAYASRSPQRKIPLLQTVKVRDQ